MVLLGWLRATILAGFTRLYIPLAQAEEEQDEQEEEEEDEQEKEFRC